MLRQEMTPEQLLGMTVGITVAVLLACAALWFFLRKVLDKKHDEDPRRDDPSP